MRRSLVFLGQALWGLGACDGPPARVSEQREQACETALAKLQQQCLVVIDSATRGAVTCDDQQRCAAGCVESASCEDINYALQGGINGFSACVDVCAGTPVRQVPESCKAAEAKLYECGLSMSGVCTEAHGCFSSCVMTTSCADINGHVAGQSTAYTLCTQGC